MARSKTAKRSDASLIFFAKRAAERLIERTSAERGTVISFSRDEAAAIGQQMLAVSSIAERFHLEKAQAGSLPPDVFPGPAE